MTDDTTPADEPKGQDAAADAHAPEVGHGDAATEAEFAGERRTAPEAAYTPEPRTAAPPLTVTQLDVTEEAPVTELIPALEPPAEPTDELTPEPSLPETAPEATEQAPPEAESGPEPTLEPASGPQPPHGVAAEPEAEPEAAKTEAEPAPAKPPRAPRKPRTPKAAAPADAAPATSATEPEAATATAEAQPESKRKWYAVKVQSGREESIKAAIERKVKIEGLEEFFGQIMIPVEEEIVKKQVKVKDKKTGETTYQEKKVTRKKKKFQGYLFAEVEFNDRILYLFRETSGVGDFLNLRGTPPVPEPMPDHEVQAMLTGVSGPKGGGKKSAKVKLDFEKGDKVRIRDGPFANSEGEVKSISEPKDPTDTPKVTVVVTIWGRPVDVDLDYWHVDKV